MKDPHGKKQTNHNTNNEMHTSLNRHMKHINTSNTRQHTHHTHTGDRTTRSNDTQQLIMDEHTIADSDHTYDNNAQTSKTQYKDGLLCNNSEVHAHHNTSKHACN